MSNPLVVEIRRADHVVCSTYDRWGAFDPMSILTRTKRIAEVVKDLESDADIIAELSKIDSIDSVDISEGGIEWNAEHSDVAVEIDLEGDVVRVYDIAEITASIGNFIEYADRWERS